MNCGLSNSELPVPVNVILFGKGVFADVRRGRLPGGDPMGFAGWVLDPWKPRRGGMREKAV